MNFSNAQKLAAEALGSLLLVAAVVGSGIMAANLSGGNNGVALLGNTIPTGAILVVLITILGPISGAHFNPAVSLVFALRREMAWPTAAQYVCAQIIGACAGAILANTMFGLAPVQAATTLRGSGHQWLSEVVATFALMGAIFGGLRFNPPAIPWLVGLTITSAYWFTASTSFANPAVTIARTLSDTFAGIAPASAPAFIVAQLLGALLGLAFWSWLLRPKAEQNR
ncbi:MAG: aquaporin family protein [Alphaproteobacteria bacterium]|nr:aquaporin family protein [Alphaproteobacteria bacterium]